MTSQTPRTETPTGEQPPKKSASLSVPGLLAGAAASATSAVVGGQLSVAGTVLGAAVTSIVSGVAVTVYSSSLERSRHGLKKVRATVAERVLTRTDRDAAPTEGSTTVLDDGGPGTPRPRLRPVLISTGVIVALAVAAIFAVQLLTGTELSSGTGQIQRTVTGTDAVAPRSAVTTPPDDELAPGTGEVAPTEGTAPTAGSPTDAATSIQETPGQDAPAGGAAPTGGTAPGTGADGSGGQLPGPDGADPGTGGNAQPGAPGADSAAVPPAP